MEAIRRMPAKKSQGREIAKLLYNTEKYPNLEWGAGSKEDIIKRLTKLVEKEDTRYSYKYTTVAMVGGEVAGILIALPYDLVDDLDRKTSRQIMKSFKIREKIKYVMNMVKFIGFEEANSGEMYIANIATLEKFRGHGIGTLLMKEAERVARNHNLKKCSLLVNEEKKAAKNLYNKLNYNEDGKIDFGDGQYIRMIKNLTVS